MKGTDPTKTEKQKYDTVNCICEIGKLDLILCQMKYCIMRISKREGHSMNLNFGKFRKLGRLSRVNTWKEFLRALLVLPFNMTVIMYLFQFMTAAILMTVYYVIFPMARAEISFVRSIIDITFADPILNTSIGAFLVLNYALLVFVRLNKEKHEANLQSYAIQATRNFIKLQGASIVALTLYNVWYFLRMDHVTSFRFHPLIVYLMLFVMLLYHHFFKKEIERKEEFPAE